MCIRDRNQYIVEKQELKGSCPYLYAWNGTKFEFVKDIFWRNALGMPLGIMSSGDMAYAFHHSTDEYVKIPGKYLKTKDENYFLKVSMELWETAYYDNIRLHVIDHPKDTYIYVDEKFLPYPKLEKKIFSFSNKKYPISVFDDKGNDLLNGDTGDIHIIIKITIFVISLIGAILTQGVLADLYFFKDWECGLTSTCI